MSEETLRPFVDEVLTEFDKNAEVKVAVLKVSAIYERLLSGYTRQGVLPSFPEPPKKESPKKAETPAPPVPPDVEAFDKASKDPKLAEALAELDASLE